MNEIDEIIVTGGRPLHGSVRIQGSKNAALPVMAAALLSTGTSVLRGCPRISDVYLMEKILKYLGAETWWASCGKLRGAEMFFQKRSVGATEQGILAAVLAEGKTVLNGCACEPEIYWLCHYLTGMGAKIRIRENGCICIEGVEKLEAGDGCIPPDRIVAGTYLMAAAATRGEIILENPPLEEMDGILDVYRKMGGQCRRVGGKRIVNGKNTGFPLELLETEVYPGFPTDLQSPAMAVLATIPGVSRIREKIFEDRYKTASWLCKMGAQIQIRDGVAVIYGGQPLTGCTVEAEELRGGAALVIAALAAQGITRIRGCCFIERGYEHICEDLTALGGLLIKDRGTL